jgi:hypothetical protein
MIIARKENLDGKDEQVAVSIARRCVRQNMEWPPEFREPQS